VLFNGADAFDQMIDFFGKAGDILHGQFEGVEAQADVFEFGANIGEASAGFLVKACNLSFEAGDLGSAIGDVAGESGKSPLDQRLKSIKTFVERVWHTRSISPQTGNEYYNTMKYWSRQWVALPFFGAFCILNFMIYL